MTFKAGPSDLNYRRDSNTENLDGLMTGSNTFLFYEARFGVVLLHCNE